VLNKTGGPNWANNFVDSPIIAIPENDEFYKQPMFYAISHFSKFVPRNSYRIFSKGPYNSNLQSIAFSTPENKTVIVIANKLVKSVHRMHVLRNICIYVCVRVCVCVYIYL